MSLNTVIDCNRAKEDQADRIAELSQRTNRFNLSGERYDDVQIRALIVGEDYEVLSLFASDKYGEMGIVCAAIVKKKPFPLIESFNVSCRVFGRGFETILISKIKTMFKDQQIYGVFKKSEKNQWCSDFYHQNGIIQVNHSEKQS